MNKLFSRLVSSFLAITFLTVQNPVLAQEIADFTTSFAKETNTSTFQPEMLEEITSKREEFVKHFRMNDGSMAAIVYSDQIHYKDGNNYKEIDNSLMEDGEEYKNTDSPFKVRLSKNFSDKKLVTVNLDDHEISWNYIKNTENKSADKPVTNATETKSFKEKLKNFVGKFTGLISASKISDAKPEPIKIENFKNKARKFKNKKEKLTDISKCSSKAKYKNANPEVDFDYTLSGLGLKENIILNKKLDNNDSFDFEFKTNGLKIKKEKDGSLIFVDNKVKTVFVMPKGTMWDSAENYGSNVNYEFKETEEGYIISVIPDKKWLETAVYPVTIDPSLMHECRNGIQDMHVSSTGPIDYLSAGTTGVNDGYQIIHIKCENLPALTHGEIVTKSILNLKPLTTTDVIGTGPDSHWGDSNNTLSAKKITGSWDLNINWDNRPSLDSAVQDYAVTNSTNLTGSISWDITRMAKDWYQLDNPNTNNGLAIETMLPENASGVRFVSSRNTDPIYTANDKPCFEIHYRNFIGEEPYWSYTNHGAGLRGSGKVNNYAGTLSVSENILSYPGTRTALSVMNTYNNAHYNEHANTHVQEENFANGYAHSSSTGYGWSLDFNRLIYEIQDSGDSQKMYDDGFRYIYIDDDGTWHYFKSTDVNNPLADCTDEDGLDLTLKHIDGKLEIHNNWNDKLVFEKKASLSPDDRCFVLTSSVNSDGNEIIYDYTSQPNAGGKLKVSKITEVLNDDGNGNKTGRETTINYGTNGMVSTITDADNKTITFTYDGEKLTEIKYPDEPGQELKTFYNYDPQGRLSKIRTNAGSGSSVVYTYKSDEVENSGFFKIGSVTEYSGDNQVGNSIQFNYKMNKTEITYVTGDSNVPYHENTEIWQFDNDGRVTSAINANGEMLTQYYMNKNEKSPNADRKQAYKIKHANDTGKYANNLLKNTSAENSMNNWETENWGTNPGNNGGSWFVGNETNLDHVNLGTKSFKISQSNSTHPLAAQSIVVPTLTEDKKYTFSANVKIDGTLSGNENEGALLQFYSWGSGIGLQNLTYGETLKTTDNQWRRISLTATASAGATSLIFYFGLKGANGTAWFDCLQVEEGEFKSDYNAIENSSFNDNLGSVWTPFGLDSNVGDGVTLDGRLQVTGTPTSEKGVYQDITINKSNAVIALRATAEGVAVPELEPTIANPDPTLRYYVGCLLTFEDGYQKWVKIPFNPYISEKQHIYGSVNAEEIRPGKKLITARVQLGFSNNCNTVYFDDVQLCVDDKGVSYERDEEGYITKIFHNNGQTTTFERDPNSKEITKTSTLNNCTENTYYDSPNQNRLKTSSSVLDEHRKVISEFIYDEHGNVTNSKVKGNCPCQKFLENSVTYSNSGNYPVTSTDSGGNTTNFEYYNEENGLLKKVTAPNGSEIEYEYDEGERVTKAKNGNSQVNYNYTNGVLDSISNAINVVYSFVRDTFGKTTQTKVGNQTLSTNTYDNGNGLLKQVDYANNQSVAFDYNRFGMPIKKSYENAEFDYTYDNKNRLGQVFDSINNWSTTFEYDLFGRIDRIRRSDGVQKDYHYTKNNLIDNEKFKCSGVDQARYNAYLPGNRLKSSTVKTNGIDFCSDYLNFDHLGRKIHLALSSSKNSSGGLIKNWNYVDGNSENTTTSLIKDVTYKLRQNASYSTDPDLKFSYDYDSMGNISVIKENDVLKVEYFYDSLNQLSRENNGYLNKTIKYEYDLGGNIQNKKTYDLTPGNNDADLSGLTPVTVTYDYSDTNWKDKLTSYDNQAIAYDDIGNPLQYKNGWNFEWTRGKRLDKALKTGYNVEYKYDDGGIRTQKTVDGVTTEFITDGMQILAQKTGNETIIWQIDGNGEVLGFTYDNEVYYYLKNAQGDIVGIVNAAGTVVATYTYDSWGKLISINDTSGCNIGEINPLRYRGYYYDSEIELYYLNARYYDPETGRFISADDNFEGGLNLYSYCLNNPVNFSDPEGKFAITAAVVLAATWINYEIIKSTLWTAGVTYLRAKGLNIAKDFYSHGMYGNGKEMTETMKNSLITAYKNSTIVRKKLDELIKKYAKGNTIDVGPEDINFDSSEEDLQLAIGGADIRVKGDKIYNGKWILNVEIGDDYDFKFWSYLEGEHSVGVIAANNLGAAMQSVGMMKTYKTNVKFQMVV